METFLYVASELLIEDELKIQKEKQQGTCPMDLLKRLLSVAPSCRLLPWVLFIHMQQSRLELSFVQGMPAKVSWPVFSCRREGKSGKNKEKMQYLKEICAGKQRQEAQRGCGPVS